MDSGIDTGGDEWNKCGAHWRIACSKEVLGGGERGRDVCMRKFL